MPAAGAVTRLTQRSGIVLPHDHWTDFLQYRTHEVDTHAGSTYTNVCMRVEVSGVINLNSTFLKYEHSTGQRTVQ